MAAQQVDAQAALVSAAHSLGESAAGGGNSVHQSQSVRHKSSVPKKTPVTKKVRPKRKAAKRFRRDRSRSEESRVISETNDSLSSERALRIPCRAPGCQLTFSNISEADAHVKAIHSAPRVDSLNPLASLNSNHQLFASQPESNSAQLSPEPVSPKQCDICCKFFASADNLATHRTRKHNSTYLKCPIPSCATAVLDQQNLIGHILDCHQSASNQANSVVQANPISSLSTGMNNLALGQAPSQHLSSLAAPPSLWQHGGYHSQAQIGQPNFGSSFNHQITKSGQDRLSHQRPRVHVLWPHECVDSILAKRSYAYKELSGSALAAGSLASLFQMNEFYQCPESIQVFLRHLSFIFHCLSYSNNVKAILDFHTSILSQIEAGLLSWSSAHEQTFTLQRLNFRSGLKDISTSNSNKQPTQRRTEDAETERKRVEASKQTCLEFNKLRCSKTGDHDGKKHLCYYCWYRKDLFEAHPGDDCPNHPYRK